MTRRHASSYNIPAHQSSCLLQTTANYHEAQALAPTDSTHFPSHTSTEIRHSQIFPASTHAPVTTPNAPANTISSMGCIYLSAHNTPPVQTCLYLIHHSHHLQINSTSHYQLNKFKVGLQRLNNGRSGHFQGYTCVYNVYNVYNMHMHLSCSDTVNPCPPQTTPCPQISSFRASNSFSVRLSTLAQYLQSGRPP